MHYNRMHTTSLLTISHSIQWGGLPNPLDADPPPLPLDADPPLLHLMQTPLNADPPVNRMTHRCKNITLPQTSFAGGKYHSSTVATISE